MTFLTDGTPARTADGASDGTVSTCDLPLAARGLVSYRCRCTFGWIMIGATDDEDAFRQALRSSPSATRRMLQRWDGLAYIDVAPDSDARSAGADGARRMHARQCHYGRIHHIKRVRELSAMADLNSEEVRMLRASRAILNGESPATRSVDLSDAAYLVQLDAFEREEQKRRSKPYWEPDWSMETEIDKASSVADAMDRYYKHDRLNRPGGTRERLIADRERELEEKRFACVASHHDSVNGRVVYLRSMVDGLSIWCSRVR
ncbi:conserved protein of unknown function (plasmid) [Paraburkholderia kururiensis]